MAGEPKAIGEFVIESLLGEGGMGKVYRARQVALDRWVALKVLAPTSDKEQFIQRFYREARSAARLVHPNIVQIYTIGEHAGTPYFAMEYIDGIDLERLFAVDPAPLNLEETIEILRSVTKALSVGMEHGVVHRDIKPSNIMLARNGLVKVMDFGLAKSIASEPGVSSAGLVVGTPTYMSPEQGAAKIVDIRSDIYSLGCVLYQCLCGRPPFNADNVAALIYKHAYEQPVPPGSIRANLPPELEKLCLKMLAKKPEDRFKAPGEVIEALAQVPSNPALGEILLTRRIGPLLGSKKPPSAKPAAAANEAKGPATAPRAQAAPLPLSPSRGGEGAGGGPGIPKPSGAASGPSPAAKKAPGTRRVPLAAVSARAAARSSGTTRVPNVAALASAMARPQDAAALAQAATRVPCVAAPAQAARPPAVTNRVPLAAAPCASSGASCASSAASPSGAASRAPVARAEGPAAASAPSTAVQTWPFEPPAEPAEQRPLGEGGPVKRLTSNVIRHNFQKMTDGRWTYKSELGRCSFAEGLAAAIKPPPSPAQRGLGDCLLCANWNKRVGCALAYCYELEARKSPQGLKLLVEQALAWTGAGNVDRAVELLDIYVKNNPEDAEGYRELARIYDRPDYRGRDRRRAIVLYQRFAELAKAAGKFSNLEVSRALERASVLNAIQQEKSACLAPGGAVAFQCFYHGVDDCFGYGVLTATQFLMARAGYIDPESGVSAAETGSVMLRATSIFRGFKSDKAKKEEMERVRNELSRLSGLTLEELAKDPACMLVIPYEELKSCDASLDQVTESRSILVKGQQTHQLVFSAASAFKADQSYELLRRKLAKP